MFKRKFTAIVSAVLGTVLFFSSCSLFSSKETTSPRQTSESTAFETSAPAPPTEPPYIKQMQTMTLQEKAGQVIMCGLEGQTADETFKQLVQNRYVGGVILFSPNISGAQQLTDLTNQMKALSGNVPLLIAADEEGGRVSRLPDTLITMPSAADLAASGSTELCFSAGKHLGKLITSFGLSTGFSPDLDIWSNPDNTVIGDRAFGTTAQAVSTYGIAAMKGINASGAIPVAKHFPGHGDTETDSHYGLPVVTKTKEALMQSELIPFKNAVAQGVPAIMAAHILCSELDKENPASLSKTVVTDLLKGEMEFKGMVFTDDLTMEAITEQYTVGEAAVKALNAGCDMILVCHGYENAFNAADSIQKAVEDGTLSEERLNNAVQNILKMKTEYNVNDQPVSLPDIDKLNEETKKFLYL